MCGIAGFVGQFERSLLGAMNEAVVHRGPDGSGELFIERTGYGAAPVGFAHRRLSIIDLSPDGRQPMSVQCGRCGTHDGVLPPERGLWLTYNGEIYNFQELRRDLVAKGHTFRSKTDSEVLLHLYAEYGVEMLKRLNGIFAFALYDGRSAGQHGTMRPGDVLLARDGLGVKPMYFAAVPEGVLFSSEIKALLQSPAVPRDLNPQALHYHLAYLWSPAPETVLQSVRKLPPGSALVLRNGRIHQEWSFYDLPYGQTPLKGSSEEIAQELRERLRTAVERQMVADVPVGAFLSGGLDSSAVVAMMRKVRPDFIPQCFSIGFRGEGDTEGSPSDLPYAREVARHLGVDLQTIEVEPDVISNLDRVLYHLDEPQADPAPINALLIAEQARAAGIKVLLSGAGGDDIFSGYRRHRALRMERHWSWLPRSVRRGLAVPARAVANGRFHGGNMHSSWIRRPLKAFAHADLDGDERLASYFWWSGESSRRALYSRDFSDSLGDVSTAAPLLRSLNGIPGEADPLNRMLFLETKHFLADHNLNYTDKMGMAAGVEVRVPLLDPDLVDFATRVPSGMKQNGSVGKAIFKQAMEPYLPRKVIYRPKTGFGAPLRRWLHHELREQVEDTLSPASLKARGLFDPAAVARLLEQDRLGQVDGAYTIFSLMCIERWCQIFVDVPTPAYAGVAG